ncbi:MAG: FMN-binding protein [Erysipelotrichaceae bacterium]
MKKLVLLCLCTVLFFGCAKKEEPVVHEEPKEDTQTVVSKDNKLANGTYRGAFTDPKSVEVEFEVENDVFKSFKFRALSFKGVDYLNNEDAKVKAVGQQYVDLGDYLVGKSVDVLDDLYSPANITKDVDGFTAATVRSSKVISAINDGIARKPYKLADGTVFEVGTYSDGTYRGAFTAAEQLTVEFVLKDNKFDSLKLRNLSFQDVDYLKSEEAPYKGIASQYQECLDYLTGKDVSAVLDLYKPENVATDVDGMTAATLRSNKLISAIFNGLNRGVYKLEETSTVDYDKAYENGTYRGAFVTPSDVELEMVLKDNVIESIKYRALGFKGVDYLKSENETEKALAGQYQALLDYLTGKNLNEVKALYTPGEIAEDVDGFTGATIRSSKVISAINDALTRGVYKKG